MCQQLLPCPFCEGEIEVVYLDGGWIWRHKEIEDCECVITHSRKYTTENEAITSWNAAHPDGKSELHTGDPIFYLFAETGEIEEGTVTSLGFRDGVLKSIGVCFADDADEFHGEALGRSLFMSRHAASNYHRNKREWTATRWAIRSNLTGLKCPHCGFKPRFHNGEQEHLNFCSYCGKPLELPKIETTCCENR
jgi:hypothetical protein